jgi:glucokinase
MAQVAKAIGIDVGGTKIAGGVVDVDTGRVLRVERVPTAADRGGAAVLRDCADLARRLGAPDLPVGIGICEMVDTHGRITSAETIEWRDLDVSEAAHGGPLLVESDVRAAAMAESDFGAGRGLGSFLYVIVGTGASCVLVQDGVPWKGARGNAIVLGSPPVELVASGLGLARRGGKDNAEQVLNDPDLAPLVREAVTALGSELAALVNALDPEAVIVGGGLGTSPAFFELVEAATREGIEYADTRALAVLPSALGGDGGVIGAALAATRYGGGDVDRHRPLG